MKRRGKILLSLLMMLVLSVSVAAGTVLFAAAESNLATDGANWSSESSIGYTDASFDAQGMKMSAYHSAMLLKDKVAKNSKVEIVIDGQALNAGWGNLCVMFKAGEGVAADAGLFGNVSVNYLAFKFGTDGANILECKDGAVTATNKADATIDPEALSGYDYWYAFKHTTTITLETTDTPTGVNVKITYLASGTLENLTGNTYTLTYSSTNTALAGDYYLSIGAFFDKKEGDYIGVKSVTISAQESNTSAANVDALIEALPETITKDNYATAKPSILEARNAYETLSDTDKEAVTLLDKLVAAENALKVYENAEAAKPVNDQIAALPTEITSANYTTAKIACAAARFSYAKLTAEVQAQANLAGLEAVETAIAAYEATDEGKSVNLATDVAYWRGGINPICFSFDERGMGLWDTQGGAMVSNQTVPANSSIYVDVKGMQTSGQYGNMYVVFKSDAKRNVFNGSVTPVAEGNYLALMIGGDGCKIYDCANGTVNVQSFDAANNLDAWFFYKQNLNLMITTKDTDTGVDVTIEFVGPSGSVTHKEYQFENPALKGDGYMSVELFLSAGGSGTEWVNIRELSIVGMETAFVPDLDIAALNTLADEMVSATVTTANVEQVRTNVQALKNAMDQMNYTQSVSATFNAEKIAQIEGKLTAYETNVQTAQALDAQIDNLPAQVNADNYDSAKTAIAAARTAYNALTAEEKALVTKLSQLEAAESALAAYESSQQDKAAANAVDEQIKALPAEITAENYETAKQAIESARTAYNALSDSAKAAVTESAKLTAAEQALKTYEDSIKEPEDTEKSGCGSSVSAGIAGMSVAVVLSAVVVLNRKKKA